MHLHGLSRNLRDWKMLETRVSQVHHIESISGIIEEGLSVWSNSLQQHIQIMKPPSKLYKIGTYCVSILVQRYGAQQVGLYFL